METINVFVVQTASPITIFIHKHERYTNLQEAIAKSTEIPSNRQLLLLSNRPLSSAVDTTDQQIQEFPKAVLKSQLFLFDRKDSDFVRYKAPPFPEFPVLAFGTSLSSDASIGKRCTGVAYYIEAKLKGAIECQSLLKQALFNLWHHIKEVLLPIEACVPVLEQDLSQSAARLQSLKRSQTNLQSISSVLAALDLSPTKSIKEIDEILQQSKLRLGEIQAYMAMMIQKMKEQDILYSVTCRGCEEEEECLSKFQHLLEKINSVYNIFAVHKKYQDLHMHEIFVHRVESWKLAEHCVKSVSLYQGHCLENLSKMHKSAVDYMGKLLKHLTRSDIVEINVQCVLDRQNQVNEKLDKVDECYRTLTQSAAAMVLSNNATLKSLTKVGNADAASGANGFQHQQGDGANGTSGINKDLLRQLLSQVDNLQIESSELDRCLQIIIASLVELIRLQLK